MRVHTEVKIVTATGLRNVVGVVGDRHSSQLSITEVVEKGDSTMAKKELGKVEQLSEGVF